MWAMWVMGIAALGVAVWALLRASPHMEDPRAHRLTVLVVAGGFALVLAGPPLWRAVAADPGGALATLGWVAGLAAAVFLYAWVIRRAHARAGRDR